MVQLQEISASEARYIKLGQGGIWAHDCLLVSQTLRLGYRKISHDDCAAGNWDKVRKQIEETEENNAPATVSFHLNQIKAFYEKDESVLWITFHADQLWWCFAHPGVVGLADGTKERRVKGTWSSTNINKEPLTIDRISGKVTMLQGFKGTICKAGELEYLLNKINRRKQPLVVKTEDALVTLRQTLEQMIQYLNWRDFETLVDLIFQRAGWQRLSGVGGTKKTLDITLLSPITHENIAIQVKSSAKRADFLQYKQECADMQHSLYYFVVHTPGTDLTREDATDTFRLWFPETIARMAVQYGLAEWIIDKVS